MKKQDKINAKIVAIDNAIASLRIEGLFVSQKQQQNLNAYAKGSKTLQQVLEETHQRYVVAL
jgi:hypothetical protein